MIKEYVGTYQVANPNSSLPNFYFTKDNIPLVCMQEFRGKIIKRIKIIVSDKYIRHFYKATFFFAEFTLGGASLITNHRRLNKGHPMIVWQFRQLVLKDFFNIDSLYFSPEHILYYKIVPLEFL